MRRARRAVTPQPDPPEVSRWNAVFRLPSDTSDDTVSALHGYAWMAPVLSDVYRIRLRVVLMHASPNAMYSWQIERGRCNDDRGTFGPPVIYQPLHTETTGYAATSAFIPLGFPTRGSYSVRVAPLDTAVHQPSLCGTFTPPG